MTKQKPANKVASKRATVNAREGITLPLEMRRALELETLAWKQQHNALEVKARWTFTTQQARVKLKRLYPELKVKPST